MYAANCVALTTAVPMYKYYILIKTKVLTVKQNIHKSHTIKHIFYNNW